MTGDSIFGESPRGIILGGAGVTGDSIFKESHMEVVLGGPYVPYFVHRVFSCFCSRHLFSASSRHLSLRILGGTEVGSGN